MKYDQLEEFVVTLSDISCSNCNNTDVIEENSYPDACEEFYNMGWRSTRYGNVYCPECARKKGIK